MDHRGLVLTALAWTLASACASFTSPDEKADGTWGAALTCKDLRRTSTSGIFGASRTAK